MRCRRQTLVTLGLCFITVLVGAETPLSVRNRKQLFIDNRFVVRSEGLQWRMNPAQKLGRILDDKNQPMDVSGHTSRVVDLNGRVQLYVGAGDLTVLESDDGLHFKRTPIQIGRGELPTIFHDPHDPDPARRFKLFWLQSQAKFNPATDGLFAAASPDGRSFGPGSRVLPLLIDNPAVVDWDERLGRYVIFTRVFNYHSENQRQVARLVTDDPLKPWPYTPADKRFERLSLEHVPAVLAADAQDNPHSDIYYNAATLYREASDVYLLFTAQFRHFSPERNPALRPPKGAWEDFGFLEVQLAVSRDGEHWLRPSREPYFPTGLPEEWDRWYAVMAPGLIRRGSYLYQYYCSTGRTHDSAYLRPEFEKAAPHLGGIGVTRQRLDGFVSLDADHRGGWLETPLMLFEGARLRLNIDTGATGTARVEILDAAQRPLPGYTVADCLEIGGNFLEEPVVWKRGADLSALAGKPIRLRIHLVRSKLYAFQFTTK